MIAPDRQAASGTLSITRPSGAPPLNVVIVPLHIKTERFAEQGPIAAIFVTDPDMPLHSSNQQQQLRELYSLTAGEARFAAWLLQGKSVDEAAVAMGITVNTARAYLKRIYQKTGVRRQPELMRLLLLGLPRLRGTTSDLSVGRAAHVLNARHQVPFRRWTRCIGYPGRILQAHLPQQRPYNTRLDWDTSTRYRVPYISRVACALTFIHTHVILRAFSAYYNIASTGHLHQSGAVYIPSSVPRSQIQLNFS